MSEKKEFQLFDNYDEDGQLSLFSPDYDDWDEDWVEDGAEDGQTSAVDATGQEKKDKKVQESNGPDIRVKYCSSCGKILFVREETSGFYSECNNCGVKYYQKV